MTLRERQKRAGQIISVSRPHVPIDPAADVVVRALALARPRERHTIRPALRSGEFVVGFVRRRVVHRPVVSPVCTHAVHARRPRPRRIVSRFPEPCLLLRAERQIYGIVPVIRLLYAHHADPAPIAPEAKGPAPADETSGIPLIGVLEIHHHAGIPGDQSALRKGNLPVAVFNGVIVVRPAHHPLTVHPHPLRARQHHDGCVSVFGPKLVRPLIALDPHKAMGMKYPFGHRPGRSDLKVGIGDPSHNALQSPMISSEATAFEVQHVISHRHRQTIRPDLHQHLVQFLQLLGGPLRLNRHVTIGQERHHLHVFPDLAGKIYAQGLLQRKIAIRADGDPEGLAAAHLQLGKFLLRQRTPLSNLPKHRPFSDFFLVRSVH